MIALTFLDPVCTTDCPLVAQEFDEVDQMLGGLAPRGVRRHRGQPDLSVRRGHGCVHSCRGARQCQKLAVPHRIAERTRACLNAYGIDVAVEPAGAMVAHSEIAYLIDQKGRVRDILNADPGTGTAPMRSSFAGLVVGELRHLLEAS